MAQAKVVIAPDAICVSCAKFKRDHGSVYKAACDRFRLTNDYVSVMDSAPLTLPSTVAVLMPDGSVEIRTVPRR